MAWQPYLPEPLPAYKEDESDPEPVALHVLRDLRDLCANFRDPPRQFRRIVPPGTFGWYRPESDVVAVDPFRAGCEGMGGDDGYYACLVHELLHATGHPKRLNRGTAGDYSPEGDELEEGTVLVAQRIVLAEIGFTAEAVDWHTCRYLGLPVDQEAAERAAAWVLGRPSLREDGETILSAISVGRWDH